MEKPIWFQRSQLIVMLRATMSTDPFCSDGIRWAAVITAQLVRVLVAEDRFGHALTMSMSKPSILPVSGLREPSR